MNENLEHLLTRLRASGIFLGPEEYARVRVLLASRVEWSLPRLRESLVALLAKSPGQQERFRKTFNAFFAESLTVDLKKAGNVQGYLRELSGEEKNTDVKPPIDPEPEQSLRKKSFDPIRRPPRQYTGVVVGVAALVIAAIVWWPPDDTPDPIINPPLNPPSLLEMGNADLDAERVRVFTLPGNLDAVDIASLDPTGEHASDFERRDVVRGVDDPKETITVTFRFHPGEEGYRKAELEYQSKGKPVAISLQGYGMPKGSGFGTTLVGKSDLIVTPLASIPRLQDPTFDTLPVSFQEAPPNLAGWYWGAASLVLLGGMIGLGRYLSNWRRLPQDAPATLNTDATSPEDLSYSFSEVGDEMPSWLAGRDEGPLADLVSSYVSDRASRRLHVSRTIGETIHRGMPVLRFEPQKHLHTVLVLEDESMAMASRSTLPAELAAALEGHGIPVMQGRFRARQGLLFTRSGLRLRLKDLADHQQNYEVLLFTDGGGFGGSASEATLSLLADWPRVAWMEMRDSRVRAGHRLPAESCGIPVFSASVPGLHEAFATMARERSATVAAGGGDTSPIRDIVYQSDTTDELHLETFLGDALMWAGDCSFLEPCSFALAESLRRRFHPHVSRLHLQRLLVLPGVQVDRAGFAIGGETLGKIRGFWLERRQDQSGVLKTIYQYLEDSPPEAKPDSPAYLVWEAAKERILLEVSDGERQGLNLPQGDSAKRLAELAHPDSAVHGYLSKRISGFKLPDSSRPGIPIRVAPGANDRHAWHRVNSLLDPKHTEAADTYPLRRGHWAALGMLTMALLTCVLMAVLQTAGSGYAGPYWSVPGAAEGRLYLLQDDDGQSWEWGGDWTESVPVPASGRSYSVSVKTTDGTILATSSMIAGRSSGLNTISPPQTGLEPLLEMRFLEPGTFTMGEGEEAHQVTLTQGFFMGKTEVTQALYQAVVGKNPSKFRGNDLPVESVSYGEAVAFCEALTKRERALGRLPDAYAYTLPTEAQWEYACRAGTTTEFSFGEDEAQLGEYAWYYRNSKSKTHPVGRKKANQWGLHDMHGNVFEWCLDWYGEYEKSPQTDPTGPERPWNRVFRGGAWSDSSWYCRSASRSKDSPESRDKYLGFRVAAVQSGITRPPPEVEMVPIRAGEFLMGSLVSETGEDNETQHEVTLTRPYRLGKYEVTQKQYQAVMGVNPSRFKGYDRLPVEQVSWEDAMSFCGKLTELHHQSGRLKSDWKYTLPTEAQWEYACRAGTGTAFSFGDDGAQLGGYAWYEGNSESKTHPVGGKKANQWGLHDMHGNVWEWCLDWYGEYEKSPQTDPTGPEKASNRVIRGGAWYGSSRNCRSADRYWFTPVFRGDYLGFRVAAVQSGKARPRDEVEMVEIKPGKFLMGSPLSENDRGDDETQHEVTLTKPFRLGKYEVTQGQYEAVMGENPSRFATGSPDAPVENVNWNDAVKFCEKLTESHHQSGLLEPGWEYTLPTEAQWEYACRAGTGTAFSFGDDEAQLGEYAWYEGNSEDRTHPVGRKVANAWGLHDMHGNVWEWCLDDKRKFDESPQTDPSGSEKASNRVIRGGAWNDSSRYCRSASRFRLTPEYRVVNLGFRVAAVQSSSD